MPPVPAGMRRPTMTFSLRPSSVSILPCVAASVRTRVVSWKDAAEMKRACLQRRLGDAEQHRLASCRAQAFGFQLGVLAVKLFTVNLLADQHGRFASVGDFNLLQHLANDHFDVLVVDAHALQTIDFLDFIDEVRGQLFHALDRQNVMRRWIAVHDVLALFDEVAFLHRKMLALRDQVFNGLTTSPPAERCGCGACSCSHGRTRSCPRFRR